MKRTKSIAWSCPSSPNADKLGFKKGCWTVSILDRDGFAEPLAGFATPGEAVSYARALETVAWHATFLRYSSPQILSLLQPEELDVVNGHVVFDAVRP